MGVSENRGPYMTMLVNRFIHSFSPQHPYSSWVLRKGSMQKPHRDIRNGPFDSWIISLSPSKPSDGLWVADRVGTTCKQHQGKDLLGTVLSLDKPKTFNARKLLHAGHVQDTRDAQDRIVLVAFSTLNAASLQVKPPPNSKTWVSLSPAALPFILPFMVQCLERNQDYDK